jgi:hypothetical protein
MFRLVPDRDSRSLNVQEYDLSRRRFQDGLNSSLRLIADQRNICEVEGIDPLTPRLDQSFLASPRVFKGEVTKGIRYPATDSDSGWCLLSAPEDSTDVQEHHLLHLLESGLWAVTKYLALPPGYWFEANEAEHSAEYLVWYDPAIASE